MSRPEVGTRKSLVLITLRSRWITGQKCVAIRKIGRLNLCNILAWTLMITVNGLAGNTAILGGKTTGEISNANPTLITPAGYAFAIWGVIYILLGVFVVYQALPHVRDRPFQKSIGWLFMLSSASNILWLFAWQYEYLVVSVVIMFVLLAVLITIYVRLNIGRAKLGWGERLMVHLPFSVYLGWITVAAIANVAATLVSIGWDGFGIEPELWAVLMILVATTIAILVAVTRRDVAYELVIIWALVGIGVNQSSNQVVVFIISISIAAVVAALIVSIFLNGSEIRRAVG